MLDFWRGLLERWRLRVVSFAKWVLFACIVGGLIGVVGGGFHEAVNWATAYREAHPGLLYLLPLAGLLIWGLYRLCGFARDPGTN